MSARGASRAGSFVGTLGLVADAYMPSREVDDRSRNEKRGNFARPTIQQVRMFTLDDIESADSRSNVHAYTV